MNTTNTSILKIIAAIITISIGAQLTLDVGNIPITGQTLVILIWAFFLDPKESFIAILLYLVLGFIGLPIFADGSFGFSKLAGGSGGYLIGFLVACVLVSFLNSKNENTFFSIMVLTFIGTALILALGISRLIMLYGLEKGLEYGFYPFWQGALIKIIAGSSIVYAIKMAIHKTIKDQ